MGKFISPQQLYDDPSKFVGILAVGLDLQTGKPDLTNAKVVHGFERRLFPDWPEKISKWLKENSSLANGHWFILWAPEGLEIAYPIEVTEFVI